MTPGLTDYMDYNAGTRSVVLEGEAAEESILRQLGQDIEQSN